MKRYPKYKDSGVEWIGEIPGNWMAKRIKYIGDLSSGTGFPNEEQGLTKEEIPFYKVSDMNLIGNEIFMIKENNSINLDTAKKLGARFFNEGDIIFPKVGVALLTNKRRILTKKSCIDNNIMGLKLYKDSSTKFIYYYLLKEDFSLHANPGAVPSLNEKQVSNFLVHYPTPPEQKSIANYLDHKTHQIDTLIEKKQKQIELLKEQRTAIINHAVTKGLNPDVKMKDSGIEWLGEIPAHWEISFLKRFCNKITDGSHFSPPTQDEGYPYVTVKDVDEDKINFDNCKRIAEKDYLFLKKNGCQPKKFDLLLTKDGTIGKAVVIKEDGPFVILSSLGLLTPNQDKFLSDFLRYYLISGINVDQMFSNIRGSALTRLTIKLINNLIIICPPLSVQEIIIKYLDSITNKFNTTIERMQIIIDLLKEYRITLISEAATGKIDVRDEVPT